MFQQDLSSIVVDIGSLTTKAGYSGEDTPKYLAPSFVGNVSSAMEQENLPPKYFVGDSSLNLRREGMDIQQVYSHGRIVDFDRYEKLLTGILTQEMRVDPSSYSLLLSEDNIHNRVERENIARIAFETLNIKNLFFCKTAVLSCFATGRSTALVVDSGADTSSVVTVHDGFALGKSAKKVSLGGQALTKEVGKYIQGELNVQVVPRVVLDDSSNLTPEFVQFHKDFLLRDIKESLFRVDQTMPGVETETVQYELPDKTILKLDRTRVPDIFFTGNSNLNFNGVHHLVNDNINQCDVDIKKELFGNMIITGGNSLLTGFTSKLQNKVSELAPANVKLKLITFPFLSQRKFAPWIGGSILSSLTSFQSFWVGQGEWKQHGAAILDKKCA